MIMQDENGIRYYLKISKIARLSNFYLTWLKTYHQYFKIKEGIVLHLFEGL